jgi:hypothetical protein
MVKLLQKVVKYKELIVINQVILVKQKQVVNLQVKEVVIEKLHLLMLDRRLLLKELLNQVHVKLA